MSQPLYVMMDDDVGDALEKHCRACQLKKREIVNDALRQYLKVG